MVSTTGGGAVIDSLARSLAQALLRRLRGGTIEVDGVPFGLADGRDPLRARVRVHSPRAWRMLLRGSSGLADGFARRLWDADDLVALVRLAARNMGAIDRVRRRLLPVVGPLGALRDRLASNTRRRSRRRIAAHYDLGNDFFELFLDETMTYSCALFESEDATLEDAQLAKLERICAKLDVAAGHRVVEIGTGWGALAIHLAATRGCHVTTATLSPAQYRCARERVRAAGLEDRVEVLLCDYRDLTGRFDRLVSIEMVEAVGWRHLPLYFRRCAELLADNGAMLIQAITIDDRLYEIEKSTRSFMATRIFPGGSLPSLEVIGRIVARHTDCSLVGLEDITPGYPPTLRAWRERFLTRRDEAARLGYPDSLLRLWELYLAYCEAGFAERRIRDVQLLIAKPGFGGEQRRQPQELQLTPTACG